MKAISVVFFFLLKVSTLTHFANAMDRRDSNASSVNASMMIKRLQETHENIEQWKQRKASVCVNTQKDENQPPPTNNDNGKIEIIKNLPSKEMTAGVDNEMLQLCATISGGVYTSKSKNDFEEILNDPRIRKAFPNISLRWFQNGFTFGRNIPEQLSADPPTFVAVIVDSTLILGWRGTVTIKDMLSDAKIDSIGPWGKLKGLEVQEAYYRMITKAYFRSHGKDIQNYIMGKYNPTNPNGPLKGGTPITRIILTGHSLGGGLAQVAHLFLKAPRNTFPPQEGAKVAKACEGVEVKTLAFSAPMTTVLKDDLLSPETLQFLKEEIEPNMRNFVYNADVVPRGYSDLAFIDEFVQAFINEEQAEDTSAAVADWFAEGFVKLHLCIFEMRGSMVEQAQRYRHVGKLIYYENPHSTPTLYADSYRGSSLRDDPTDDDTPNFRDLHYRGPKKNVADTALENHMVLVTGPGLVYPEVA